LRNRKRVYNRVLPLIGTGRERPSWTGACCAAERPWL
jgi:hypothetical protein